MVYGLVAPDRELKKMYKRKRRRQGSDKRERQWNMESSARHAKQASIMRQLKSPLKRADGDSGRVWVRGERGERGQSG